MSHAIGHRPSYYWSPTATFDLKIMAGLDDKQTNRTMDLQTYAEQNKGDTSSVTAIASNRDVPQITPVSIHPRRCERLGRW